MPTLIDTQTGERREISDIELNQLRKEQEFAKTGVIPLDTPTPTPTTGDALSAVGQTTGFQDEQDIAGAVSAQPTPSRFRTLSEEEVLAIQIDPNISSKDKQAVQAVFDFQQKDKPDETLQTNVSAVKTGQIAVKDLPAGERAAVIEALAQEGVEIPKEIDDKSQEAVSTIDTLFSAFNELPSSQKGRFEGQVTARIGELFPEAAAFEDIRKAFAGSLKLLVGETGRLTDQDISRILGAIPSIKEPEAKAEAKKDIIRKILEKRGITPPASLGTGDEDERGFVEKTLSGAKERVESVPIIGKPLSRSLENIATAGITIPQAKISSVLSAVGQEELGADIASRDILGTQSRAQEIAEDPVGAFVQQATDSIILGAAGKGGGAVQPQVTNFLNSFAGKKALTSVINKGLSKGLKGDKLIAFASKPSNWAFTSFTVSNIKNIFGIGKKVTESIVGD